MNNRYDLPYCLPIGKITKEGTNAVTLNFLIPSDIQICPNPGQYFMLWNPGDDEIPISISNFTSENKISFTICSKGQTSENFLRRKESELVGLRGPYGNGFKIVNKGTVIILAGGMGIAPLRYLLHKLKLNSNVQIILIYGSRSKNELFFKKELENLSIDCNFCTDDGSVGYKGFPTDILNKILKTSNTVKISAIYTCGPEIMLKNVLKVVKQYSLEKITQISLADRYIRCGFGICGSCVLDDQGLTICRDGPVFGGDVLDKVKDFGNFGRKSDGSKYKL